MSRSTHSSSPTIVTPDYATPSLKKPGQRGHHARIWIAAIILLGAASIVCYMFKDAPTLLKLSTLQKKCLTYQAPADQIVYSEAASDITALSPSSPQYVLSLTSNPPAISFVPDCWTNFKSPLIRQRDAVVFLGQRTTRGGEKRLIGVTFSGWGNPRAWQYSQRDGYIIGSATFDIVSFSIVSIIRAPSAQMWSSGGISDRSKLPSLPMNVKFFAGQPDPADSSRFTIAYEANGKRGTIEGVLGSKDSEFSMKVLDGPLKKIDPSRP